MVTEIVQRGLALRPTGPSATRGHLFHWVGRGVRCVSIERMRVGTSKLVLRVLPWVFIVFAAAGIVVGVRVLAQLPPNKDLALTPPNAAIVNDEAVKDLQRKTDDLRWILTVILGAAGLFTIAQGAAAFFTAQTFVKQADDAIKRVQEVALDAERRYPVFSKAEEARRDAYRALAATFYGDGLDWRDTLYDQMQVTDRQRLISVERFIGLEFIGWAENDQEFAVNLRRLANFYASKYVSEGRTYRGNRERAEYYLQLACKVTNDRFWILNDLGLLFLELYEPKQITEARTLFEKSYAQNPRQQRALYNLAVMATYETPPRWEETVRLLKIALREPLWERTETPEMTCNVHYNLACAQGRLRQFDLCLKTLEHAARIGHVRKKTVDDDADLPNGDLYRVATHDDANIKQRFCGLRRELSQYVGSRGGVPSPRPLPLKDRASKAWQVLRGKS